NEPEQVGTLEESIHRATDAVAQPGSRRRESLADERRVSGDQTLQRDDIAGVDGRDGLAKMRVEPRSVVHQVFRERRFHSPRTERMMASPPVTPSATRVQMKKTPPGALATVGVNPLFRWMMGMPSATS